MWKSENAKMANAKCAGSLLQQELSCAKECCEFNCRQGGHSHSRAQSGCWWWGGGVRWVGFGVCIDEAVEVGKGQINAIK